MMLKGETKTFKRSNCFETNSILPTIFTEITGTDSRHPFPFQPLSRGLLEPWRLAASENVKLPGPTSHLLVHFHSTDLRPMDWNIWLLDLEDTTSFHQTLKEEQQFNSVTKLLMHQKHDNLTINWRVGKNYSNLDADTWPAFGRN